MELQPLREEEDDEREPLRGGVPISEEEWRNLDWFIGQSMIRPLRCAELIYLIAVPSIATVGGFFTTQKTGFPVIFYFMYLPLLLGSKVLEVYILKGWGDIDCNAASIQRAQWAKIGFRHPVMLLIFGSLEHADLFLDVVFTATAFSSGFVKLGICSILCLVASLAVQYLNSQLSALAMVVSGRDVYIPLVQVWGASCLQGMQWLAATTKAARFGEGELVPDMGLEDARVSATVATEQIPQMVMQAMYFRFSLDNLSQQARIKQWVSMSMSVAVMLLKLQKRGRWCFLMVAVMCSLVVAALVFPAEVEDSHLKWV